MSDEDSSPSSRGGDQRERNTLRVAWECLDKEPTNNAQRAFHGWEVIRERADMELLAVRETGNLYACHDGVWRDDGEQVLREYARQMMASDYSTSVLRELKDQVRATNAVPWARVGLSKGTAAVRNGLLGLETRELRGLRPEDRALYRLPVAYDPEAECPRWREFLREVTDGEAAHRQLQEFVGYALAGGEPWLKKALMIFGPTDAGKTVFLDVVGTLFGEDANAAQTPQYLANQRWGLHQLVGKPVNIRHDVDSRRIQNLGIIKEVISGDQMTAEQKGKDPFQFVPRTRLMFAANQAPERTHDDEAFWNRWVTVVFPKSVPEDRQKPKPALMQELTVELPGVLNWALDGLDRLREQGGFTAEQSPDEVRRLWEEYGTPVERFKAERLVVEPGAAVKKSRVQDEFTMFCLENRYEDLSDQELTRELTKDPAIGGSQWRLDGARPRVYTGIRLAEDDGDRGHEEQTAAADADEDGWW